MKKTYTTADVEILLLEYCDAVTSSPDSSTPTDDPIQGPEDIF